ncbi:hypothetical protein [Georgenia sp. AZ-5]|uniref:hypothetical protein n=1 Tax=Georgenia sp. AZ-5 TaxID=3367526 RepID=UPI003754F63D
MDDTTPPVSAAEVIADFFARSSLLRHPATRARARRVRAHLETYLDTEAERFLTRPERALVDAERQLDPAGAVVRVTGPEALVATLPGFVDRAWLMPAEHDARVQLLVVAEVARWAVARGLVDRHEMACAVLELEARLDDATAWLDGRAGISRSAPPGPRPPVPGP